MLTTILHFADFQNKLYTKTLIFRVRILNTKRVNKLAKKAYPASQYRDAGCTKSDAFTADNIGLEVDVSHPQDALQIPLY